MPKNKLTPDVIEKWPEVLDHIDVKVVPIEYIRAVEVSFNDGKLWVLDIDNDKIVGEEGAYELESSLEELLEEYEEEVQGINFVVDIEKVKRDVTKRTHIFMKKRK